MSSTHIPKPPLASSSRPKAWESTAKKLKLRFGTPPVKRGSVPSLKLITEALSVLLLFMISAVELHSIVSVVGLMNSRGSSWKKAENSNSKCYLNIAHCDTTVARMLVGNKCDLETIRDLSIEEGKTLAEEEDMFFMETSALGSTNVKEAFELVIREIYNVSRKVLNSDTYKPELTVNRVSLAKTETDASMQTRNFCCSS
ncbi:Ras-related protein RABA5d [Hibiscus syriacus]|uniref:Ras-related protein RABA5d n=1 Tax=Hibiscus syriacus TaxID=106335 RepID=A0A6A3C9K4_HIBSY|nr:Ras-related protein RABA5d [Hibiscus syriacus]